MSKLSFRARALDASKPLPIYMSEELPDLPEYSAINRAVPQMPSGMEKEEECEHHLQRAIVTGLIIPTPEVSTIDDKSIYDRLYPANYKPPRQLIHMQPFSMEEDIPDYDIDSEDEKWLSRQKLDITPFKFEEMMDKLEKNCVQNVTSQDRKDLLLKDNDEVSIAVFDYWLSKRLRSQPQPLVPCVRTEANNRGVGGYANNNNPYLAFRRRTEKMQTRKNRKNDETSYEKMIKLRRDLSQALQLLELVKKRESTKKDLVQLTIKVYEKRYQANDFSGSLLAEVSALKPVRPAPFTPLFTNQYATNHSSWSPKPPKDDVGIGRKEKRQYKKRKHKGVPAFSTGGSLSSGEEDLGPSASSSSPPSPQSQQAFPFLRNKHCSYHSPLPGGRIGSEPWVGPEEGGSGEERYRYSVASLSHPKSRCVGLVRRRVGRGGRVILDRTGPSMDDFWSSVDFTIQDSAQSLPTSPVLKRHFRPKTPPPQPPSLQEREHHPDFSLEGNVLLLEVESLVDCERTQVDLDLGELFPDLELETLKSEMSCDRVLSKTSFPPLERWSETKPMVQPVVRPPPPPYTARPHHSLPSSPVSTVRKLEVNSGYSNGPTPNDHGFCRSPGPASSGGVLSPCPPSSSVVCKWNNTTPSLNSKLPARPNQITKSSSEDGDSVRKQRNPSVRVVHTHTPMEVT